MGTTSHKRQGKRILAVTLALLAASQLAGCGGSDNNSRTSTPPPVNNGGNGGDGGDGGNNPPAEQLSGVFVDAPVAGLNYTTSSDLSGTTDVNGRYSYNAGDTVTFSIGDLVLGAVPGQGVVTPMTVATALAADSSADVETVAVNLLVLLQSLDADGNPDNGITFTAAIRDAIAANSIDLTAAEGAFTTALNTFVTSVSGTSGVTLTAVDRADAVAHFQGQAPGALAGVYVRTDENFAPVTEKIVTLTMFRSGRYLLGGQHDSADCALGDSGETPVNSLVFSDAGNGVEYGSYTWDPLTNAFSVSAVNVETDGYCGFNRPVVDATNDTTELEITTDGLVFRDTEGNVAYRFARMESDNSTIAGTWLQPTALMQGHPFQFTLFASSEDGKTGRYLMVDASAPDEEFDTSPGIEEGCYSVDANDNLAVELNSSVCADAIDTNDTAGVSDTDTLQLLVDENDRMVIVDGEDVTGFARFPSAPLTNAALAGAWVLEHEPGAELGTGPQLAMLTVFEDGRFLFGTHEDDPSCVMSYPTPGQEADGNGLEYGTLSLTSGLVVPNTTVDTNGECGLFDVAKEFEQRYFVAPNAAGDAFALWANDEEDPAGIVFKRVPSVPNEITGAWLWTDEEAGEDEFAVVAYLPSGVMFEASLFPGESGLRRETFTMDGETMTSQNAGYEYCVDTESEVSECLGDPESRIVETYSVDGDVATDDEGSTMARIPSP